MPSQKPGPFPYDSGATLKIQIRRFLDAGSGSRIEVWDAVGSAWVTYVEANKANYLIDLAAEDTGADTYVLDEADYPTWDLETETYLALVYDADEAVFSQVFGAENSNVTAITGYSLPARHLANLMATFRIGTVVTDAGNTASTFKTDLEQLGTDYYRNRVLAWPEGSTNETQGSVITAFNDTTQFVTVAPALASAPVGGELFILGGRINT